MRNRYLYVTLLSILAFNARAYTPEGAQAPRLVISICVDMLRSDLLENYSDKYTEKGLKLLLQQGYVFTNASNNYAPVDRASATTTITTGTVPYYHGITGEKWLNRETLRPQSIIFDKDYKASPSHLAVSTLGDELKIATDGKARIFAFAPSAECAILSAGHAADGAAWIQQGRWTTTNYYTPTNQWLNNFCKSQLPGTDTNMSVAKAAVTCIDKTTTGLDDIPDFISISLTTSNSLDSYLSLDRTIEYIIKGVSQKVPADRVLFVLTGSGNGEEERKRQADYERFRVPTGKFYINRTAGLLNIYLGAIYGTAQYVETCFGNQLFINRKLIDRKNINMGDLLSRSQEFILQLAGVRNVYTSLQLATSDSQLLQRVRNGFNAEHCGELIIDVAPGWELVNEDTQSSTISVSGHISFPIIFWGANIKPQRVEAPVTSNSIAPTVAKAIRIRAPNACVAEPLF